MNREKQLKLAVLCGFPADHKLFKEMDSDPESAKEDIEDIRLEKEDLFKPLSTGDIIFEYKEGWDAIEALTKAVRENGETLAFEDFKQNSIAGLSMWSKKTIVEVAVNKGRLEKLFHPVLWENRPESEMIDAWFDLSFSDRTGRDLKTLWREVAAARGHELREDQLDRMDIKPKDIRDAIRDKKVAKLNEKMAAHGDHLRKEDLFIPDSSGDYMLDTKSAWEGFDELWKELEAHDERLSADDFLRHVKGRKSMAEEADNHSMLSSVFNAQVWHGRPAEMLDLHGKLPTTSMKDKIRTDKVLDEIADMDYGRKLKIDDTLDRQVLLSVLNKNEKSVSGEFHPVIGLGLKTVWDNIAKVGDILRSKGESIALEDLRATSGYRDETCLRIAANNGSFGAILDILRESGERLTMADLTDKGKDGRNILTILADRNEEGVLLKPENWIGHGHEFLDVWKALPQRIQDRNDFPALQGRVNLLTVRRNLPGRAP